MSIATASKLNRLLSENIPGGLLFATWLRKAGYSSQLLNLRSIWVIFIASKNTGGCDVV